MNAHANAATPTITATAPENQFDMSNPEHVETLKRYYDAQAILMVTAAGYEVETADEAWAIIRGSNLMNRLTHGQVIAH